MDLLNNFFIILQVFNIKNLILIYLIIFYNKQYWGLGIGDWGLGIGVWGP